MAARHCGYTFREFLDLPGNPLPPDEVFEVDAYDVAGLDNKASVLVQYRIDMILERMGNDG